MSVDCPTQVIRSDDGAGNQVFFQKAELTIFLDLPWPFLRGRGPARNRTLRAAGLDGPPQSGRCFGLEFGSEIGVEHAKKALFREEIIAMLREADVRLSQGETVGQIARALAVSEQSYYRWRRVYGGLKVNQAKRFKELEKENQRLRRAVADLTLDTMILKEATRGNF